MLLNLKGKGIMKELNIYPLTGLFMELQKASFHEISVASSLVMEGKQSLRKANRLFWANHLAPQKLASLMDLVQDRFRYSPCYIPQFQAALDNPDLFLNRVEESVQMLSQSIVSEKKFFSSMECLTILYNFYSDFVYKQFRLTIDQGFLLNEIETRSLVKNCLSPITNPYFNFIDKYCRPVIKAIQPDVIWAYGQPSFSTFAMAMIARKAFHLKILEIPKDDQ
jgi:hypothetical protein